MLGCRTGEKAKTEQKGEYSTQNRGCSLLSPAQKKKSGQEAALMGDRTLKKKSVNESKLKKCPSRVGVRSPGVIDTVGLAPA